MSPSWHALAETAGARVSAKLASDFIGRVLLFGLLVVAARTLDLAQFGAYAYALATGLICGQLADSGLQFTLLRRLAHERDRLAARDTLARSLRARALAGIVFGAGGAALAAAAGRSPLEAAALAGIALAHVIAAQGDLWLQVARAAERLELEAAAALAGRVLLTIAGGAALVLGGGLPGLAIAYLGSAIGALLIARSVARRFVQPAPHTGWAALVATYAEALPLAVAGIFSLLMFRIDALLLQWLQGATVVGAYTAAYRPFEASLLVSVAVMAGAFPGLVRLVADEARFRAHALRVAAVLLASALGVAAAGWLVGPAVLTFAFGPDYAPSGGLLRILVLAVPLIYLNALLTQALIARGRLWAVTVAMAAGLAANVLLNLALIPTLGAAGAAISTIVAEAVLCGAALVYLALVPRAHAQ